LFFSIALSSSNYRLVETSDYQVAISLNGKLVTSGCGGGRMTFTPGALWQACIDNGNLFIYPPSHGCNNPQQMSITLERGVGLFQNSTPFNVDLIRAVYQDVADAGVLQ
jgi:hypothetical protein